MMTTRLNVLENFLAWVTMFYCCMDLSRCFFNDSFLSVSITNSAGLKRLNKNSTMYQGLLLLVVLSML